MPYKMFKLKLFPTENSALWLCNVGPTSDHKPNQRHPSLIHMTAQGHVSTCSLCS